MVDSRAGAVAGVHSIDHFALFVPSLKQAGDFFDSFGLDLSAQDDSIDVFAQDGHRWARLLPAERKSLAYISFNCFEADFQTISQMVTDAGARLDVSSSLVTDEGLWFHDVDGNLVQIRVGLKTSPGQRPAAVPAKPDGQVRAARMRSQLTAVKPTRLSHVLLFTPDVLRAVAFYEQALGLRLSDRSGEGIAFTHAPHGSDHHLVAFGKSGARGWHHSAWDVPTVDEVGRGAMQMAAKGYTEGWGTGRHVLGSNYFFYVRDPWGSFCEYSAEIDFIPADAPWPSGDFAAEEAIYQWGPDIPSYFLDNSEV